MVVGIPTRSGRQGHKWGIGPKRRVSAGQGWATVNGAMLLPVTQSHLPYPSLKVRPSRSFSSTVGTGTEVRDGRVLWVRD